MHAGLGKAAERFIGLVGVIDHPGHHHRRGAILKQIDAIQQFWFNGLKFAQQIFHGPCHAMAFGLPGHDDGIELRQFANELFVFAHQRPAAIILHHLRPQHRIVFGERVIAFDLNVRLALARDGMEEHRLFHGRHQRMTDAAQHGMIRPDGQLVLAALLQLADVMQNIAVRFVFAHAQARRQRRIEAPPAAFDVFHRDQRVWLRMPAVFIDKKDRMENLHGLVCVHSGADFRDGCQIAIHKLTQAAIVIHGAGA